MCLAVYIGASHPLKLPAAFRFGELGVEVASWTPAPLKSSKHVYYIGRKGEAEKLECSCLLSEQVDWMTMPPTILSDELFPKDGACPFDALRGYCEQVLDQGGLVTIACDDSGGVEQVSSEGEYDQLFLLTDHLRSGRLIFADPRRPFHIAR